MAHHIVFMIVLLSHGVMSQISCDNPDIANAKCKCAGTTYDFSNIQNADGTRFFSASGPDGYTYFFEMVNDGLPSSFAGCDFPQTYAVGNAVRDIVP